MDLIYTPPHAGAVSQTVEARLASTMTIGDFGGTGDGSNEDAAFAAAFAAIGEINNTAVNSTDTTRELLVPAGRGLVTTLDIPPGVSIVGAGREATKLIAEPGHAGDIIRWKRPATITSSRTRKYGLRNMSIFGSSTPGCVGLRMHQISNVSAENVDIFGCDIGVDGYDVVKGVFTNCTIQDNLTGGVRLLDGCNAFTFNAVELRTTANGPNLEVDGNVSGMGFPTPLETFCFLFNGGVIESALNGVGALIGERNGVLGVVFSGVHFEQNAVAALQIGSPTSTGQSYVVVQGGKMSASGKPEAKGIEAYGANIYILNPWLEGIPTIANRLILEPSIGSPNPVLFNVSKTKPSGSAADRASLGGFALDTGLQSNDLRLGGRGSDFGLFTKRQNDVAYQGDNPLWIQTELRTTWQGRASLSSGVYDVVFSSPAANSSYAVTLGSEGNNHLKISNKTIFGFRISAVNSAGETQLNDVSGVHWHCFRNQ